MSLRLSLLAELRSSRESSVTSLRLSGRYVDFTISADVAGGLSYFCHPLLFCLCLTYAWLLASLKVTITAMRLTVLECLAFVQKAVGALAQLH